MNKSNISYFFKTTFRSLQYRNFRLFWFGQCISLTGTWVQRTAQTWLVYTVTGSPVKVGLVSICQFVPILLFSLFAGVVVDRFSKKKIIIFTQIVFMLQAATMTILTFTGQIQFWHILVLSTVFGLAQTLDMPARQAYFIDLVGPENLTNAISLNSTIFNLARIVGPALSGLLIANFSMVFCFSANTISFIPVILGICLIRSDAADGGALTGFNKAKFSKNVISDIKDGLRYIKKDETLSFNVLVTAMVCTFAMNLDIIVPVFAKDVLGRGIHAYTTLLSMAGFGAFTAAILMSYISKNGVNKKFLLLSGTFTALFQIAAGLIPFYFFSAVLIFAVGFSNLIFMNVANGIFQVYSSNEYRGRVISVYSFLNQGSTPVGSLIAGGGMELMGGAAGFISCGMITLLFLGIVFTTRRKTLRDWFRKENNPY